MRRPGQGKVLVLLAFGATAAAHARGPTPATHAADERGLDIKTISSGKAVALRDHLARDKVTIFDFTADWCKPCQILGEKLADFARREKRIAIRKIDVTRWNTPVVREHLTGIKGLPYVEVFDRKGRRVTSLEIPKVWKIEDVVAPLLK